MVGRPKQLTNYYDEGKLYLKVTGQYSEGQKVGLWQTYKINQKETELLAFENYTLGEKNGLFKEVRKDSIIFGSYKNGNLHGSYSIYKSLSAWLMGGLHGDTTNNPLIVKGYYFDGLKNREWKYYSNAKGLLRVGRYENDLQTGIWKYYYDNHLDEKRNKLPYSGELFLIETYNLGEMNGRSVRYSYIEKQKVNCNPRLNENINSIDTCYSWVYRKLLETSNYSQNKLHGFYELRDSLDNIISKGNYISAEKNDSWLERFKSKRLNDEIIIVYQQGSYEKGKRIGVWNKYFDLNEEPFASYTYKNGILHGRATMPGEEKYFENGKLIKINVSDSLGVVVNSYQLVSSTDSHLKCVRIGFADEGRITKTFSLPIGSDNASNFYSDSNYDFLFEVLLTTVAFADGEVIAFDKNDRPTVEGIQYRDKRTGAWRHYFYDQNIYTEREYTDGEAGRETYYLITTKSPYSGTFYLKYSNGSLQLQFKISDGLRNGNSKYYKENGVLERTEKYRKGLLQN